MWTQQSSGKVTLHAWSKLPMPKLRNIVAWKAKSKNDLKSKKCESSGSRLEHGEAGRQAMRALGVLVGQTRKALSVLALAGTITLVSLFFEQ